MPCHNDLLAANFIREGERIRIVDWEYAGMGDRYFDLGNFAVNNELDEDARGALLEAYFGEPPDARRLATLRLMRFMSDFREAMWGVVQSGDLRARLRLRRLRRRSTSRGCARPPRDPRFEGWLREARWLAARELPDSRPLRDHRRRRRRDVDRLPPRPSSAGRTWCCSSATS